MKVLRVIARLNVGGPARHVVLLDRGLRANGWDTLLVHGSVGPGEASLEHLVADERLPALKIEGLGPRLHALDDVRACAALLRAVFRTAPDVIHTHTAKAGALGRVCALLYNGTRGRSRRALVVHTFHGHVLEGYFGRAASAAVRTIERALAIVTDRIVAISPRQRADLVERFRVAPAERVVTIPLGLNLEPLLRGAPSPAARAALGIAPHDLVVGYVGRFVPIKDLSTLLRAFAAALRELPQAWLLLAGDGPLRPELEAQAAALGLAPRVKFIGWTENLVDLYGALDICALSSINEGTPVAAIEAMAAGRLVIATAVGGVPDVIDNGRTGMLVAPRDPEALADAIVAAARDPSGRAAIGRAARLEVEARFSPDRLIRDIEELYRTGLRDKRGTIGARRDDDLG